MRITLMIFLTISFNFGVAQDTITISKIDTLIPFFRTNPLRLGGYNNRVIPFDDKVPLHVLITYPESKKANFEYFRIDSSKYLMYEYFKETKQSSNEGIKSRGIKVITTAITDSSTTGVIHVGREKDRTTREIHYFREFMKEGEWEEYEDSLFEHKYWIGNYKNNKRIGLWKHFIYWGGDDFLLEEIEYSKDSTTLINAINIANTISLDSFKILLRGRWQLRSCDSDDDKRMAYSKCRLYDGHYGDDCNNKWAIENYYDFVSDTKLVRQRGEGCYKFRESSKIAWWNIIERNNHRIINLKFTNGQTWKLNVLYLDYDLNLITDRE